MSRVSIYKVASASYLETPPFHSAEDYPEYPFEELSPFPNPAYEGVRGALMLLGMDRARQGTRAWNPLSEIVKPGQTVVVKPNLVRHFHDRGEPLTSMVTHGSVVRAISDYVILALGGTGKLIICDAPQDDGDFGEISRLTGLAGVRDYYRSKGVEVELLDLRPEMVVKKNGVPVERHRLPGDPNGYVKCGMGRLSAFADAPQKGVRYRGSEYDDLETSRHHHDGVHEYLISGTVLGADVVINVPKLKTHKKAGISVCMKNLIGINGNKNWLPHHREGTPGQGGDQYAASGAKQRLEYLLLRSFKSVMPKLGTPGLRAGAVIKRLGAFVFGETDGGVVRSGNWYGNDTIWRTIVDLNRACVYATVEGTISREPRRKCFCLVDGIVGGEGNCPFSSEPKGSSVVLAGLNPVAVDSVAATLMGYDYRAIPQIANAYAAHEIKLVDFGPEAVNCLSNVESWCSPLGDIKGPFFDYKPHFGWKGHIELNRRERNADE